VLFKGDYGPASCSSRFFGDEGVDEFDNIDLRCSQNYSWSYGGDPANAEIREVSGRDTQGALGQPYTRSRFYHLYIDGQYWGLYQTEERPEGSFAASYFGGAPEDYDVIKVGDGYNIFATDGDMTAWQQLYNLTKAGFATDAAYYHVQGLDPLTRQRDPAYPVYLDVANLIDYMLIILYNGDRDAPISWFLSNNSPNNWYGIRNRDGQSGFKFFIHDGEHTLSAASPTAPAPPRRVDGRPEKQPPDDPSGADGPCRLPHALRRPRPEVPDPQRPDDGDGRHRPGPRALPGPRRGAGLQRAQRGTNGGRIRALGRFQTRAAAHQERLAQRGQLRDQFLLPRRANVLLTQLQNARMYTPDHLSTVAAPLYPSVAAPEFNQFGGLLPPGFQLTMTGPGTIYYSLDGTDPRLPGGAVNPSPSVAIYSGPIPLSMTTHVKARAYSGGVWSALGRGHVLRRSDAVGPHHGDHVQPGGPDRGRDRRRLRR